MEEGEKEGSGKIDKENKGDGVKSCLCEEHP